MACRVASCSRDSMIAFASLSSENCSFQYQLLPTSPPLDGNCLLFFIILGKILLNFLTLGMRRKTTHRTFMGCFCVSLALVDILLLANISIIACSRDFVLLGMRFTKYHICLFTQIISCAYGVLHYPVFFIACVDYYLNFSKTANLPIKWQKPLYILTVIFIWISVLTYVLGDPAIYQSLKARSVHSSQCPVYVSEQGYWLSFSMLTVLSVALVSCWADVLALVQEIRVTSYMNETVLYFPSPPHLLHPVNAKRRLLPKYIICFLGTWLPFVFLQVIVLSVKVQIPAYIEMNIPWLFFVNSFLIAVVSWCTCRELTLQSLVLPVDPFVNWKYCFIPFAIDSLEPIEKPLSVIVC